MTENVIDYYGEDSLSVIFHDLLARLEPGCREDIAFYTSLLRTSPASILELGCGSGRLSFALAKRGHSVKGIDIAEAMLARAQFQRNRDEVSNRVNFTFADMTSFSFPIKFDLIMAPYFALNHLPNRDAVMKTFVRVAEHLLTGGIFAMHLANVGRLARPLSQEATSSVVVPYDSAGSRLALDILERNFEQSTGKFTQILRYAMIRPDGSTERVSAERLTYRAIQKEELDDAAAHAGLCSSIMDLEAADTGSFVAFRAPDNSAISSRQR